LENLFTPDLQSYYYFKKSTLCIVIIQKIHVLEFVKPSVSWRNAQQIQRLNLFCPYVFMLWNKVWHISWCMRWTSSGPDRSIISECFYL